MNPSVSSPNSGICINPVKYSSIKRKYMPNKVRIRRINVRSMPRQRICPNPMNVSDIEIVSQP